jgi:dTDP-4-amino-4,6-dideoxygalactose transaminase
MNNNYTSSDFRISKRTIKQVDIAIDNSETEEIYDCIGQRWLSEGPKTALLAEKISEFTGAKHVVFAPNGTLGLFLGLLSLDLEPCSEIILPSFTFYASATSIVFAGFKPVFVDVCPFTYNINPEDVERAITPRTSAIMPVHIYGQSCNMPSIVEMANKYKLKIIEDAAQGFGVFWNNQHTGTFGDLGVISFYSDKVITMGEGAALLTNDSKLFQKLRLIRNQGRPSSGVFIHPELGMNFRITDIQSAVCLSQLRKFKDIHLHREKLFKKYSTALKGVGDIFPMEISQESNLVPFRFPFRTKRKAELELHLNSNGIETRGFFYPMHLQPKLLKYGPLSLPNSEMLFQEGLCLPVHQYITDEDADYLIQTIKDFFKF